MSNYPKVNYIGNKEKLVDWIIEEMPVNNGIVVDLFAGGCSVSYALKECGYEVVCNDVLFADYVIAKALIENSDKTLSLDVFHTTVNAEKVKKWREKISFLSDKLYFPKEVDELAKLLAVSEQLKGFERYLFLALLRRAMIRKLPYSRMNVPWNQIQMLRDEEYSYKKYKRKRAYHNQSFEDHMRENIDTYNKAVFRGERCKAYNYDAMTMIDKIDKVNVVYMDPPYPSTMNNYDAFYGMFDRMFKKEKKHIDFTQQATFLKNMENLILGLIGKTDYILISQNTRANPGETEITSMLKKYGKVEVREKKHNYQVTGKENKNATKELLFILKVGTTDDKNKDKTC